MTDARLPLDAAKGLERGPAVTLTLDGRAVTAYEGESVAAVLLAEGEIATRVTAGGSPRGVFCGMGVCWDCLVVVDGIPNTRACVTWVREGMTVQRQDGWRAREEDA
ncbi:MAG: (2Fe-2S)-binding protein [Gaiellaceae bacterium MAG52_C11]|nr:(2Fe-2S)-binding protein [Candidatus Gaiellasilicea maunaloa]